MTADLLQALRHVEINLIGAKNALAEVDENEVGPESYENVDLAYVHVGRALSQLRAAVSGASE